MTHSNAFQRYIGIDYSGAGKPTDLITGLRICVANGKRDPAEELDTRSRSGLWSRESAAHWLLKTLDEDIPTLVGIDHAFSFPLAYFHQYRLTGDWQSFLEDFQHAWPTDTPENSVELLRLASSRVRFGSARSKRICDTLAKAKSVFHFDVPGSVAKSTFTGLVWLLFIRRHCKTPLHFWPFDGWFVPAGSSAVAEIYPSRWNKSTPNDGRNEHQHDAYVTALWLQARDHDGTLPHYFAPALSEMDRRTAEVEGWILGLV